MDVRDALLKAAIKIFAETGSRGATTRRIAQEADVNEVTLFRHFKSKDELIDAALESFAGKLDLRPLPEHPVDPRAELVEWCRAQHRELHRARAFIRKAMGEHEEHPGHCAHGMKLSVRVADDLTDYLRRLKQLGLATGDWNPRAATAMLMGAIFSDAMARDLTPERYPYSMREGTEQYVDLLLAGIGAAPVATRAARVAAEK